MKRLPLDVCFVVILLASLVGWLGIFLFVAWLLSLLRY